MRRALHIPTKSMYPIYMYKYNLLRTNVCSFTPPTKTTSRKIRRMNATNAKIHKKNILSPNTSIIQEPTLCDLKTKSRATNEFEFPLTIYLSICMLGERGSTIPTHILDKSCISVSASELTREPLSEFTKYIYNILFNLYANA